MTYFGSPEALRVGCETRATAAAQVGTLDLLQNPLRTHFVESRGQGRIAADGNVVVNVGRIDQDVVLEQDALLIFVEWYLLDAADALARRLVPIHQPLDHFVADDGFFHDGGNVLHLRAEIAGSARLDHDKRTAFTEPVTPGSSNGHAMTQAVFLDLVVKSFGHLFGTVRTAAGPRAYSHAELLGTALKYNLLPEFRQFSGIAYTRHVGASSFSTDLMIFSSFRRDGSW
jgi:hypothetical protein